MARPKRHMRMVRTSRAEATLAVRLYNDPTVGRAFEAFVMHMHVAWLNLLHAELVRAGVDFRHWLPGPRRQLDKVDGEARLWELSRCVAWRWPDRQHPVRANLELIIALRNKIEHRYFNFQQELMAAFGGHAQACLLNYERELTGTFGHDQSLAGILRFPIFIGSFTTEGEQALRTLRKRLPAELRRLVAHHASTLGVDVEDDDRYELRLRVVAELAPRDPEALAIQYTRYDEMSDEAKTAFEREGRRGFVAVREQARPVVGLDLLKAGEVVKRVKVAIPFPFSMSDHTNAWRHTAVRPPSGVEHPERTKQDFCIYDARHRDYGYTQAWVERLIKKCGTSQGFAEMTGRTPLPSPTSDSKQGIIDLTSTAESIELPDTARTSWH